MHSIGAYWSPPVMWRGETAFVVGGGASLCGMDFSFLRGRRTIAINAAAYDIPFADVLFFQDCGFLENNRDLVEDWPGLAITVDPSAKLLWPLLLHVETTGRPDFSVGEGPLKRGRSSGHSAVALAVALGAARVVLLGFDVQLQDGRSHFHDRYSMLDHRVYANDFLPEWDGYGAAAIAAGVEVLNANPASALKEFPTVDLAAFLAANP